MHMELLHIVADSLGRLKIFRNMFVPHIYCTFLIPISAVKLTYSMSLLFSFNSVAF